jgi:hypothetical protein
VWTSPFPAIVAPGEGSGGDGTIPVSLDWDNGTFLPGGSGSFPTSGDRLQSIMAGDDTQVGALASVRLSGGELSVDNSGPPISRTVTIDLEPLTSAQSGTTPVVLRGVVAGANGLTGPTACAGASFAEAVADGCETLVTRQEGASCPAGAVCDVTVAGSVGTSAYAAAWAPGGVCTPNNWGDYPDLPRGDPRLITVAVTPVGAPYAAGATRQVTGFAAFYVTGWAGGSCPGGDTFADLDPTRALGGELIGHFVKFVSQPSSGVPGDAPCAPQLPPDVVPRGVDTCIATLVR